MDWPAYSPDLNTIENLWSYMVRNIYANGRAYNNVQELRNAIQECWENVPKKLSKIFEVDAQQDGFSFREWREV